MLDGIPRCLRRILFLAVAACLWLGSAAPGRAGIILYTASVDNTGGISPQSVPNVSNPNLPPIDPGVTISPNPAFLDGNTVGPISGISYGPFGFGANTGGTTGFVSVSYTIATAGSYNLIWEVSNVLDDSRPSALAIDNVRLNNSLLYGFESGIPAAFTALGSVGTSGAVTDLSPTQGNSFAYLDTTGNIPPIYDTVDGTLGSRLVSGTFAAAAGTTISMDLAFMTNDGFPFADYGIAVLQQVIPVPEPSSLVLSISFISICGVYFFARRSRTRLSGSS